MARYQVDSERVIAAVRELGSFARACERAGVPAGTFWTWRARSPDFRAATDAARAQAGNGEPMSREELERHVVRAIREKASVPAMKLWLELHPQEAATPADPFARFDELAARRSRRDAG